MHHRTSRWLLAGFLVAAPSARAGILYVDADLATGANDGSSWNDAFQGPHGLQAALAAAASGDQIFAAEGTYLASATGTRGASFTLLDGVEVYGSFLGGESSPAERPPFGTAPSVLSGDLNGDDGLGLTGENSFQVVDGGGANASAVLDGFEVRGGNANGGGNNNRGAGILCTGGSNAAVRNVRFIGNSCTFGGGAGYISASVPSFTDCTFEDNDGGSFGGAFDMASAGAVRFDRCLFARNTADRAGALEIFATDNVLISNSAFHANVATGTAGGGAVWVGSGGSATISNCSIVANSATSQNVGGVRNQGAAVNVVNSILWDNSGTGGAQGSGNQISATATVDHSTVEGGFATGTGNLASDPLLADALGGDLTLLGGSPAIDAGDNAGVPAGLTLDLSLAPRFVDDPLAPDTGAGSAPLVDMGALERQAAAIVSYCTAGTSASGCQALLGASGTPSATAATGFDLLAGTVEGAKDGLFFFGTNGRQANSWGNGTSFQCVVPPVKRAGVLAGVGTNGACDGTFAQDLNAHWSAFPQKNPGAGALVQAQLWYRDPQSTSNQTTSLSDALEFTVQP
jgi:hypothetical protein